MRILILLGWLTALAGAGTLSEEMARIANAADGKIGVAAMVVETGETAGVHASAHYPMQSVYKFPIAMAVLHLVDEGKLSLGKEVTVARSELAPPGLHSPVRGAHPQGDFRLPLRELLRYAVAESDGTASDVLLRVGGGFNPVMKYLAAIGIQDVTIATTEREMGNDEMAQYRSWSTPDAMVKLLCAFQRGKGLSGESRALLMDWMTETATGPKRIKGMLPSNMRVAHKTGTSNTRDGLTRAVNDVGLIPLPNGQHLAVAVFVSDSKAPVATSEDVIAKIARAAFDHWSGE